MKANSLIKEQSGGKFQKMMKRLDTMRDNKKKKISKKRKQLTDIPTNPRGSINERSSMEDGGVKIPDTISKDFFNKIFEAEDSSITLNAEDFNTNKVLIEERKMEF
mmetsp:Transcript_14676/g.12916  ORF Transcript_14676/g.12916 Transcript_14676/m.12916 type:complete len:106 (-) Transcript_14676:24-341(-)